MTDPGIGHNRPPDFAATVAEQLARDYGELNRSVESLLEESLALPPQVADDDDMGLYARLIKRMRDAAARVEALRVNEKEPHMRAAQAVDSFFFALAEKLCRRTRTAKPGRADFLQARLDDYNQRKLRQEQERRRLEQEERFRQAREAEAKAREEARKAEEARLAAERARKPENVAAKDVLATEAEQAAAVAIADATVAASRAEEAHVAALAKPADMVRTRVEQGPLVTMAEEGYATVENFSMLDGAKLWPFVPTAAKEQALRSWARNTGFAQQMLGASIGKRSKTVVR
jgi:chemotaxis protein histidine kinase CheA